MKFLIDVNASGALAKWLVDMGHDVVEVRDKNPRMSDEDILVWAVQKERIIVTTDQDFESMIWQQRKPHCGVLRLENLPRSERYALMLDVLKHHSRELSSGAVVIAQRKKIRIRRPLAG